MSRSFFAAIVLLSCAIKPNPLRSQDDHFLNKPATDWARDLSDRKATVRRSAAFALGRLGEEALLATPDLVRCLRDDKDPAVRDMAATALGDVVRGLRGGGRSLWPEAGPVLTRSLVEEGDARIRRSAAYALGCFELSAVPARAALVGALKDADAGVRQNAAWALGRLGNEAGEDAARELAQRLQDDEPLVRRDAATALGAIGQPHAKKAVRPLLDLVRVEPDEVVLKTALDQLVTLAGPGEKYAAGDLAKLLGRPDPETARLAAFVLAGIGGPEAAGALPILRQTLRDSEPGVPGLAAAALAGLGAVAAPAVPDLVRLLTENKDDIARRNALLALGAIGTDAAAAVPIIAQALKPEGNPPEVRLYAADALARIAYPLNAKSLPTVLSVLTKDADPAVRHRCVWVLFKVEDLKAVGAVAPLAAALDEKEEETMLIRFEASRILALRLRDQAPDRAVDVLVKMLTEKGLKVHQGTGTKVRAVGTERADGQSEVKENVSGDGRYMAAEALGWMGRKTGARPDALKALEVALQDGNAKLKAKAEEALDRIRKAGE